MHWVHGALGVVPGSLWFGLDPRNARYLPGKTQRVAERIHRVLWLAYPTESFDLGRLKPTNRRSRQIRSHRRGGRNHVSTEALCFPSLREREMPRTDERGSRYSAIHLWEIRSFSRLPPLSYHPLAAKSSMTHESYRLQGRIIRYRPLRFVRTNSHSIEGSGASHTVHVSRGEGGCSSDRGKLYRSRNRRTLQTRRDRRKRSGGSRSLPLLASHGPRKMVYVKGVAHYRCFSRPIELNPRSDSF